MFLHVNRATYLCDCRIWLAFNDGSTGEVDLSNELVGRVFRPLKNLEHFKSFTLLGHTLAWENGADFAPEFLRHLAEEQETLLSEAN